MSLKTERYEAEDPKRFALQLSTCLGLEGIPNDTFFPSKDQAVVVVENYRYEINRREAA